MVSRSLRTGCVADWFAKQVIIATGCAFDSHLRNIRMRTFTSTAPIARPGPSPSIALVLYDRSAAQARDIVMSDNSFLANGRNQQEFRKRKLVRYYYAMRKQYTNNLKLTCAPDIGGTGKKRYCVMPLSDRAGVGCVPPTVCILLLWWCPNK